ncbi:transglutaminase-like cysteine peptidase [Chelatococcus albus]|uniref:transglutaminase-like cysteine peptidase n=1 Tax=Chelatococcus albus TaxID=3047466 RepID=UPI0030EC6F71
MAGRVCVTLALAGALAYFPARAEEQTAALPPELPPGQTASETGQASVPVGWLDFCRKNAEDCRVGSLPKVNIVLTQRLWRTITSINASVNRSIEPVTDDEHWGVAESWDYSTDGKGDCEDYVLMKRRLLMQAGLPRQALLVTVVRDLEGEGHAVLTVKTDRGDLILDNKRQSILPWTQTGYRFLKRQSQENPNQWVSLGAPATATATATAP